MGVRLGDELDDGELAAAASTETRVPSAAARVRTPVQS